MFGPRQKGAPLAMSILDFNLHFKINLDIHIKLLGHQGESVNPVFPGTLGTLLALFSQRPHGRADPIGTAARSGYSEGPGG